MACDFCTAPLSSGLVYCSAACEADGIARDRHRQALAAIRVDPPPAEGPTYRRRSWRPIAQSARDAAVALSKKTTIKEAAAVAGVSVGSIVAWRKRAGVGPGKAGRPRAERDPRGWSGPAESVAVQRYADRAAQLRKAGECLECGDDLPQGREGWRAYLCGVACRRSYDRAERRE